MKHSSPDFIALVNELQKRMARVVGELMRKRGSTGATPEIEACMKAARLVWRRHRGLDTHRPDYRHTDIEEGQCVRLCNWLVEKHAELRGQTPRYPEFNREAFAQKSA